MEDGIASLYSLLHDVGASEGEAASQYELYKALEDHRARLLALFDFGARSQKEKQEVESGKIVYEGKRLLLNDEFKRAALALADELDISELYCARLLKDVELEHPNADSNARIERAVVRYHDERLLTVRCLLILFAAGTPNDANLARLLDEYKTRLATAMLDLPGGRRAKLAEKVLIEIDNVARAMSAVANALTNATTNVTAPYKLAHGTLALRLERLRDERRQLGQLLHSLSGHLSGSELGKVLEWLASHGQDDMTPYVLVSLLGALEPYPESPLLADAQFKTHVPKLLEQEWKAPDLRATVRLQWAQFLRAVEGTSEEVVERTMWLAVLDDAFGFMSRLVALDAFDFKSTMLHALERLVISTIAHMSPILRRIKHKQEDVSIANARSSSPEAQERQDIAALFALVGQLYSALPPDSGLKFWTGEGVEGAERLGAFVRWAAESRDAPTLQATFEMVAGLSTGRECAEMAFNFLAASPHESSGVLSWTHLFATLEGFHTVAAQGRVNATEVYLTASFLKIMRAVATHSPAARLALHHHPQFRLIQTMLALVPAALPLELKAALLDTASAFCGVGAGAQGVELCRSVWAQMERVALIRGVERELEMVEAPARTYPSTLAVVKLLGALVHTPKMLRAAKMLVDEGVDTLPEGVSGVPYVTFVLDSVLLRIAQREYVDNAEKWALMDACLAFVERALAALEPGAVGVDVARHPGAEVLRRLLGDTPLRTFLLAFIDEGASSSSSSQQGVEKSLLRALRILHRALEIQQHFIDGSPDASPLDEALTWTPRVVVQLALYVTRPEQEMVLLATKVLALLAESTSFRAGRTDRLAMILQGADESLVIQDGFVRLLREDDFPGDTGEEEEMFTGAGCAPLDGEVDLSASIKSAVVGLLIQGTAPGCAAPSVAHFLLGYDCHAGGEAILQDPEAAHARISCLHVILAALSQGVPRLDNQHHRTVGTPLSVLVPVLAEKFYRLVLQLCTHPLTAAPTLRYLRTREDFFARHLAAVPARIVTGGGGEGDGMVVYEDGSSVQQSGARATAFLRARAWILELVALELHVLTDPEHPQLQRAARLLELIFGTDTEEQGSGLQEEFLQPFVASRHASRVVEALQALAMEWVDATQPEQGVELQVYRGLNFDACLRPDEAGCDVYDVGALLALLGSVTATIPIGGGRDQLRRETRFVLETVAADNRVRSLQHARGLGYAAWARVVQIALSKGFARLLPPEAREAVLFDVLPALPGPLRRMEPVAAEPLAQTLVALVARLREDRRHQTVLQASLGAEDVGAGALPADRLLALFRAVLDCVMVPGAPGMVRGNLYSALVHYLHLVEAEKALHRATDSEEDARTELEAGTLAIVNAFVDRLIPEICKDAIDGAEVWKTVAFTLLDSLVRLSRTEKRHSVLQALAKTGYLQNFVLDLKHSEEELFRVLAAEPDDLNALYVYEAKMSLLIRLAQTRQGADEVYKARLFSTLATCEFLDARPDVDDAYLDDTSFLPSVVTRYHQLLLPALQLADSVLSSASVTTATAAKQALSFVLAHRETLLAVLRDVPPRVTLSVLSTLQLVVSLCSFVVPQVPAGELAGYSGFGALHAAVLAISARYLSSRYGSTDARLTDESEYELTKTRAPGYGVNSSVFEVRLYDAVALLRKWCIIYLTTASRCGGDSDILYVLLMTPPGREGDLHPTALASGPSVTDAIAALSEAVSSVEATLADIYDLAVKLNERETLGLEEIDEIAAASGSELLADLDVPQRRLVAYMELERAQTAANSRLLGSLHVMDMLLLLLCEHLQHDWQRRSFAQGALGLGTSTAGPLAGFGPISGASSVETLDSLRRHLDPTLSKLQVLQFPREILGADAPSRQKFVEAICRRIQEATAEQSVIDMDDDDDMS